MTPTQMAELHAAAFAGGQTWSEADIRGLMAQPSIRAFTLGEEAFALLRVLPPEAEILTIAVAPKSQGRGLGRTLLATCLREVALSRVEEVFLEVAADNTAALALYNQAGFERVAIRARYYARADGTRCDAIVLRQTLPAGFSGDSPKK